MKETVIYANTEDWEWLEETHMNDEIELPFTPVLAVLYGNEDSPDKLVLYKEDHYQSETFEYPVWNVRVKAAMAGIY